MNRSLLPGLGIAGFYLLVLITILPLWWMVLASVTPEEQIAVHGLGLPQQLTGDHYHQVIQSRGFAAPLINSLVVATITTALCISIGSLCAYALARIPFYGRSLILAFVLSVSMFPQITLVPPLYLLLRALNLIDTYPGLILPYITFAMPLTIWLLVGYFKQLPVELEEAAVMDGMSRLQTFLFIFVPLAMPGIATTAILTFIYCWNEFLFAFSFTVSPDRLTAPVAITLFRGRYQVPWGQILAASVIATAPVTLLVIMFQRRIVQGLTAGAVKG